MVAGCGSASGSGVASLELGSGSLAPGGRIELIRDLLGHTGGLLSSIEGISVLWSHLLADWSKDFGTLADDLGGASEAFLETLGKVTPETEVHELELLVSIEAVVVSKGTNLLWSQLLIVILVEVHQGSLSEDLVRQVAAHVDTLSGSIDLTGVRWSKRLSERRKHIGSLRGDLESASETLLEATTEVAPEAKLLELGIRKWDHSRLVLVVSKSHQIKNKL